MYPSCVKAGPILLYANASSFESSEKLLFMLSPALCGPWASSALESDAVPSLLQPSTRCRGRSTRRARCAWMAGAALRTETRLRPSSESSCTTQQDTVEQTQLHRERLEDARLCSIAELLQPHSSSVACKDDAKGACRGALVRLAHCLQQRWPPTCLSREGHAPSSYSAATHVAPRSEPH